MSQIESDNGFYFDPAEQTFGIDISKGVNSISDLTDFALVFAGEFFLDQLLKHGFNRLEGEAIIKLSLAATREQMRQTVQTTPFASSFKGELPQPVAVPEETSEIHRFAKRSFFDSLLNQQFSPIDAIEIVDGRFDGKISAK